MSMIIKNAAKSAEAELAKRNPRMHAVMARYVKYLEDEQQKLQLGLEELKEQAKVASVKSMLRMRRNRGGGVFENRRPSKHPSLDDLGLKFDVAAPVLREETLIKQGKDLRIWRSRHFVLKPEGVYYYDAVEDFKNNPETPKARVLFCDLVCPSGQAADEVPRFVFVVLNRPHVFCLHTEDRTFVVSTPSKESLKAWVSAINAAFNTFITQQAQRTALADALADAAGVIDSPEMWAVVNKLSNNESVDQVLGELLLLLHDQFENQILTLRRTYDRRRAFENWKVAVRLRKRDLAIAKSSNVS